MSKYKVGDKVVMEIMRVDDGVDLMNVGSCGCSWCIPASQIDRMSEPLSTYTEPLEDIIQKYTVKIARLVMEKEELKDENERLKAENEKMSVKIDAYELCGDQHEEEYNQAFNQGAEAAWELARKIVIQNGYSGYDLYEIFGSSDLQHVLENYTYPEATAKVAEWEKAKEEIKRGDIIRNKNNTSSKFCVTDIDDDGILYGVGRDGATYSYEDPEYWEKTGRHIDIDSFLKQIGGEQE